MNRLLSITTRFICNVLCIQVTKNGGEIIKKNQNYLVVGNHLSYMDIFILSSVFPVSFITSVEMKETFGLGLLVKMSGCVFVERRKERRDPNDRLKELKDIEYSLKNGINVVLYAEATTGNGEAVLPFRKPMFQAALNLNTPILTNVLNYKKIDGKALNYSNKDDIFWYDDMTLLGHFLKVLTFKRIEVEINFLEVLQTKEFKELDDITNRCYKSVSTHYRPIRA